MEKVLLHACCAPCSSAILEWLLKEGYEPVIYYANSNIYPREEYIHRREECVRYAREMGVEIVEAEYDHNAWLSSVRGLESEPERGSRCMECFKLRLLDAARYARDHGFTLLTTTLASSRWKSLEQINAAGLWAVQTALSELSVPEPAVCPGNPLPLRGPRPLAGGGTMPGHIHPVPEPALRWWNKNWRKGGLQERRCQIIKERNFYNQLYCGCEFSAICRVPIFPC